MNGDVLNYPPPTFSPDTGLFYVHEQNSMLPFAFSPVYLPFSTACILSSSTFSSPEILRNPRMPPEASAISSAW